MSAGRPPIDLGAFARPQSFEPPRRAPLRFIVPGAIVLAFLAVVGWNLRDVARRAKPVTVVRPQPAAAATSGESSAGAALFQAAGWVEPDPFPIEVPALSGGVVREVVVRESDVVAAGDPIARLVDDRQKIAVAEATARVARVTAELEQAEIVSRIASESFDAALAVNEAAQVARADADGRAAAADRMQAAVVTSEAEQRLASEELRVAEHLAEEGAAGPRQVEIARAKVESATGEVAQARAAAAIARSDADAAKARRVRAERDLELRFNDRLDRDAKRAGAAAKAGELDEARAALALAELELSRTVVTSPSSGVVLERRAVPGKTLDVATDAVVVTLFDPGHLRVRVDVPQSEIRRLAVGQRASIRSEARAAPYTGEVVRMVHRADVQKVTLQVHVRVADGDALLRPEMLCQVQFLGTPSATPGDGASAESSASVLIPARVVVNGSVWVIDPLEKVARRRAVTVGSTDGDRVLVLSGVNASDKVIDGGREGLADGDAVAPSAEE